MYSHGCLCGAFDEDDCIAEESVTIENWLAGGAFNSRYGWFNEGQTEGPSAHIHREFVSALYYDTMAYIRIGQTHMMSKIATAPWVTAPGQWETGALRWCFYCCNIFGDPAMEIWTDEPVVGIPDTAEEITFSIHPNPASDLLKLTLNTVNEEIIRVTISNTLGQTVYSMLINDPSSGTQTHTFDISGLKPGMYMVGIESSGTTRTRKLIITK